MNALSRLNEILKEKSWLILLCMLTACTIFACTAYLSVFCIVMLFVIVIAAPLVFDDTEVVCLYCYSACFMNCFQANGNGFYIAFGVSTAILMIKKVVFAIVKKENVGVVTKISVLWLSLAVIFVTYTLIVNRGKWYRTGIGFDLLQVCVLSFLLRKGLDVRKILIHLLCGIIASVSIAYVFCMEGREHDFIIGFVDTRFGAFFNNENTLSVFCTCCAACFIALILLDRISFKKNWFYPLIATAIGTWSMSKAFTILNIVLYLTWIIIGFIKSRNKLRALIIIVAFLLSLSAACLIFHEKAKAIFSRFTSGSMADFWSNFTTGRVEIWREYVKTWLSSPRSILFGWGFTSPQIPSLRYEHSVYIAFLYQYGIIGSLILIAAAVWTIKQNACFEKKLPAYIPIILLALNGLSSNLSGVLCSCLPWLLAVCIFSYRPIVVATDEACVEECAEKEVESKNNDTNLA